MEFWGYYRQDGSVGVRNHVLILPATRNVNYICHRIALAVPGVTTFYTTGEYGRTGGDRKRLARFLTGIARNPNVANVLLIGMPHGYGYPEFQTDALAAEIARSGKRLEVLNVDRCGGLEGTVTRGIRLARELVREATAMRREAAPLSKLTIGMKCGDSDATSGLAGNPALGRAVDRLIDAGGTALFSETLELIGAEQTLVQRAKTPEVARRLLRLIAKWEARAASIGEDIRTINPIPENIAAGITTLEEKSLGAVEKTGTRELSGVLEDLLRMAQLEKEAQLLAEEIERTRRRVNALEYIMMPRYLVAMKSIKMKLDENERGNITRLMKVKDMMLEQAHHYDDPFGMEA